MKTEGEIIAHLVERLRAQGTGIAQEAADALESVEARAEALAREVRALQWALMEAADGG